MTSPNLFEIAGPQADVYEALYREGVKPFKADPTGSGQLGAAAAAGFLKRSGLDNAVLAQVWDIADETKRGFLDKTGFFAALKLVALAQAGQPLARDNLRLPTNPPLVQGFTMPPAGGSVNGGSVAGTPGAEEWLIRPAEESKYEAIFQSLVPENGEEWLIRPAEESKYEAIFQSLVPENGEEWLIRPAEESKYEAIFQSLVPENGKLPGDRVRPVLLNSGLPQATLGKIWALSDMDQDGFLDREEMCVALHLVYRALEGDQVPQALPHALVPPAKRAAAGFSRRGSAQEGARSRSGSVAAEVAGFRPDGPQYQQHGYGPHGQRSLTTTPVPLQLGALPEPLGGSPVKAPSAGDWAVDAGKHSALFASLDTDEDGLVSGGDCRGVLINSGLPQQALAHLWGLVDINKSGKLTREQFALAMHLIEGKLERGEELPGTLPPGLVPPSLRPVSRENGAATPGVENSQIREVERELEEIRGELRGLESSTVEVEAGMAVRQSEVKNLEIELHTLESTVKQLERQQGEANRRLDALDTQKEALRKTRDDLVAKLAADETEIASTKTELVSSTATAAQKEEELNRQREVLAAMRDEEKQLEVQLQMEKANLDTQAQQHGAVESSVSQVESSMRSLAASNQLMRETLDQLNALLADPAAAEARPLCLEPIERPQINTLIKAPGENRWAASGYQGGVFAHKPGAFDGATPQRPPAPQAAPQAAPAASYYDAVPGDASTSDPFGGSAAAGGDPFAASAGGDGAGDPFAGEDPFANGQGAGSEDPFGGGGGGAGDGATVDPFAASNGGGADPFAADDKPKKPPPPRPAPPKGRSSGAGTPVTEAFPASADDPFAAAASPTDDQGGFVADFGAFS